MKLEELVGKKLTEAQFDEAAGKKDACYHKVKARYDVWPSAYASGALVKCRKAGAKNWGNKSKKEGVNEAGFPAPLSPPSKPKVKKAQKVWMKKYDNPKGSINQIKWKKDGSPAFPDNDNYDKLIKKFPFLKEGLDNLKALPKDLKKSMKKKRNEARGTCWVGYKQVGMKDKGGRKVPNCVKEITEIFYESDGKGYGYTFEHIKDLSLKEAEYQGRKVKLGKIMQGDAKKFKVYVKNPKGNVVKVNFGQGGGAKGGTMKIRKSNPKARKSFRARHNCDNPGPRHKARYWSCRKW